MLEPLAREAPEFIEGRAALAQLYYRLRRKEDGDREREIVRKLSEAKSAKETKP